MFLVVIPYFSIALSHDELPVAIVYGMYILSSQAIDHGFDGSQRDNWIHNLDAAFYRLEPAGKRSNPYFRQMPLDLGYS